jgi:hypothetical protein
LTIANQGLRLFTKASRVVEAPIEKSSSRDRSQNSYDNDDHDQLYQCKAGRTP